MRVAASVALSAGVLATTAVSASAGSTSALGHANLYFYPGQGSERFAALRGAGYEQRVLNNEVSVTGTSGASPTTVTAPTRLDGAGTGTRSEWLRRQQQRSSDGSRRHVG